MRIPAAVRAVRLPRVRLPGFVRRHPFPWRLAATVAAASLLAAYTEAMEYGPRPHFRQAGNYLVHALALVLPFGVTIAWWRRIGAWARSSALLVCGAWSLFALHDGADLARDVRAFARDAPVVDEMLREPLRAVETPPEVTAARALAAGDTVFLAVGGECARVPGVDSLTARRYGARVMSGTFHDGKALTGWHRAFEMRAGFYAEDHNGAILERLGIERGWSRCVDPRELRRADQPFFWP